MENLKIKGRIWIETDSGLKIGKGRARLLEQIDRRGSISEASKYLEIPYRRAWGIVKDINTNSSKEVVVKAAGGKSGGESKLTDYGKKIVEKFKATQECFNKFSQNESNSFSGWE